MTQLDASVLTILICALAAVAIEWLKGDGK